MASRPPIGNAFDQGSPRWYLTIPFRRFHESGAYIQAVWTGGIAGRTGGICGDFLTNARKPAREARVDLTRQCFDSIRGIYCSPRCAAGSSERRTIDLVSGGRGQSGGTNRRHRRPPFTELHVRAAMASEHTGMSAGNVSCTNAARTVKNSNAGHSWLVRGCATFARPLSKAVVRDCALSSPYRLGARRSRILRRRYKKRTALKTMDWLMKARSGMLKPNSCRESVNRSLRSEYGV